MVVFVTAASEQEKEDLMVQEQRVCPMPNFAGDLLTPHHLIKTQQTKQA